MSLTCKKNHPQEDHEKTIRNKAMTKKTITIVKQDKKTMKNRVIAKRITTLV
jgi:hypothetical protein